jgi:hypothetical protein
MQLQGAAEKISSKGAQLALIGSGSPRFIEGFVEKTGFQGAIYTDPSRKSYDAAGLIRSVAGTLGPSSILNSIKSMMKGQRQGATQGDPWQQGGALVINTQGEVLFTHRSKHGGDNISPDELLAAIPEAV